ncbi:hypothetical protein G4Y79_14880 [Phototrophicus methaneseepsis]|uniref:Uncharacterized protein n=1 Tax=Phototrophicus methaneseepsis TaxID=2710758 RepID=A0A7S8IGZ7_9CHLR|nr:DUF5989 family protein [Phototrophicus methaneseepsis]QPC85287.1 hypothetical protein G4Y79_14880 [Phototrophicus methaneseepsis]
MAEQTKKKKHGALQDMLMRMGVLGELLSFLWKRKLYWLIPMIIVLLVFAVIIIIGSTGPGGAFIYTLF